MVEYVIGSILIAAILDALDFDTQLIIGVKELFGVDITSGTFYLLFLLGGIVLSIADKLRDK